MLYDLLLFGHIVSVVVWVGSGVLMHVMGTRAVRARDPQRIAVLGQEAAWASNRLFMPASIATLVFGLLLVVQGNWEFESLWVSLGIAGFAVSMILGMAVLGPRSKALGVAMATDGPSSDAVATALDRLLAVQRIDLVILVLVIADMVLKPGL